MELRKVVGFDPIVGYELEFYSDKTLADTLRKCVEEFGFFLKREDGDAQFEINTEASSDFASLIARLTQCKLALMHLSPMTTFHPKPFATQPGSGLHINLSFQRIAHWSEPSAQHVVGGLLSTLRANLHHFAYDALRPGMFSPSHVSWGINNRTTAVRIVQKDQSVRFEHRVSRANACIARATQAVLEGAYLGLTKKIEPPKPIWGNAWDPQYEADLI